MRLELALALGLVCPAAAAEQPEIVKTAIADARQQCVEADGKPGPADRMVSVTDLDGNGGEDWILDFSKLKCDGAATLYCGTGGCPLHIYLWQGGSEWKLVFEEYVRAWKRIKIAGKPGLELVLHGSACNRAGYRDCRKTYVLEKGALRPR